MLPGCSLPVARSCENVSCPPRDRFHRWAAYTADRLAYHHDGHTIEDYPGIGWDLDRYEPDPHAEAQDAGYRRGYALDFLAVPPDTMDSITRVCWQLGKLEGIMARNADDADRAAYEADLAEDAFGRAEIHPSEVIHAVGCLAARQEGGSR